jgi:hypothetical protein
LLGGSAVAFALLAGFVSLTFLHKGFPGRLPEYLLPPSLREEPARHGTSASETRTPPRRRQETYCSFGSEQGAQRPSAILWGDSFANQYLDPLSSAALAHRIHGLIATQNGAGPSSTMR